MPSILSLFYGIPASTIFYAHTHSDDFVTSDYNDDVLLHVYLCAGFPSYYTKRT